VTSWPRAILRTAIAVGGFTVGAGAVLLVLMALPPVVVIGIVVVLFLIGITIMFKNI
jgi:hypothetical protein